MEGIGRICFTDGEIQEGFFVNGSKNGFGRTIYPKGSYYIGIFCDDKKHGKGVKV